MKMLTSRKIVFGCLAASTLAACGGRQQSTLEPGEQRSNKLRLTTAAPAQNVQQVVDGNMNFALNLYSEARAKQGNLFFSPHSISVALAMTYAGAKADTAQAMENVLHVSLPPPAYHEAFGALDLALSTRGAGAKSKDGKAFRLSVVNQAWGQTGYTFLPDYLDTLASNYGAGVKTLDFAQAAEPSRLTINDWVLQKTEQRINDLLPEGSIVAGTRLVLTNAVYFNAAWKVPFEKSDTRDGDFQLVNGTTARVPMMGQAATLGFSEVDGVQAVELPYDGDEVSFVAVMPPQGQFSAFEAALDVAKLKALISGLAQEQVQITMPKFSAETDLPLAQTLENLGMGIAFSGAADFSGMAGSRNLVISDVIHKGFVAVDEAGTEAAAATAVIVGETSVPAAARAVKLNRPFVYLIRDRATGAILFLGRVVQP